MSLSRFVIALVLILAGIILADGFYSNTPCPQLPPAQPGPPGGGRGRGRGNG